MRASTVLVAVLVVLVAPSVQAQREHTRLTPGRPTRVTEAQATELTLTLTDASVRPVQVWIRAGGIVDAARRSLTAVVPASQGARVKVGQRVRAFSPETRSRMYQARISRVRPGPQGAYGAHGAHVTIEATLRGQTFETSRYYVLEIVTEGGEFLSVPNEALIETEGRRVVYVQGADGGYTPRPVETGLQGELFTQVLDGLTAGEQVVTFGSFFIDAEHKLKAP